MNHRLHTLRRLVRLGGAFAVAGLPVAAFAGGMALTMQNGAHLGNTYSAGAAAEDASTIFYNPAGLLSLSQPQTTFSLSYISHSGGFTNNGSLTGGAIPTVGGNGGGAGDNAFVPTFYAAYPYSERFAFGFGVSAPYGLATEYEADWVGRYHAIKSELKTINLTPAIAWQPTENISIGLGLDWQIADAELTNAVDFGLIGFSNAIPGLTPGSADGLARVEGDDSSVGFNVGVLFDVAGGRLGVHYRSQLEHTLEGDATFTNVPAPFAGMFANGTATAPLTLPEKISVSYFQNISENLAVMADWSWWNWSRFDALRVDFTNGATPDVVQPQNWRDASIYSAGVRWTQNPTLTWRAGVAYNESPVPSAAMRSARIPDSDRVWLGIGATWRASEALRCDFGFAHLFMSDSTILNDDGVGHVLSGSYSLSVNIVSAQAGWSF